MATPFIVSVHVIDGEFIGLFVGGDSYYEFGDHGEVRKVTSGAAITFVNIATAF